MSTDTITAIGACFIALLALLLGIWEAREARQHARLSVIPKLMFDTTVSSAWPEVGIKLLNKGVGPALIDEFRLLVDGKRVESNSAEDFGGWRDAVVLLGIDEDWIRYYCLDTADAVGAGESIMLFGIAPGRQNADTLRKFETALPHIQIVVRYRSFYDDRFTASLRPR